MSPNLAAAIAEWQAAVAASEECDRAFNRLLAKRKEIDDEIATLPSSIDRTVRLGDARRALLEAAAKEPLP